MKQHLIIEKFGKIEKADIQISPLTLFVGDNNSGKSYLLSLVWGLYAADISSVLFRDLKRVESYEEIFRKLCDLIIAAEEGNQRQKTQISSKEFIVILNEILEKNKDKFVAGIFNYEQVSIQKLEVLIEQEFEFEINSWKQEDIIRVSYGRQIISFLESMTEEIIADIVLRRILLWFLKSGNNYRDSNMVYLPAARTGFVLAKNVINRVSRQVAYDMSGMDAIDVGAEIQPFTKPIIRFLDMLEELSLDNKTKYAEIVAWMEQSMTHGSIQYDSEMNGKEIRYVPAGSRGSLPLRTSSAVVTELTPLIMLLKYKRAIGAICYEEPEMCLHPQLQQEMGKLLIRLVNSGVPIIATTHSDIIIQHINNMCRLKGMGSPEELLEKLELSEKDAIDLDDVAVYQFTDRGEYSVIDKVIPQNGEFSVKTFSNALMRILEQTSEVQDFEPEQGE